jgi:hypothetical protein
MDSQQTFTRRTLLRRTGGMALVAVPALALAQRAEAGRAWCRVDPAFAVDGIVGNVFVSGELNRSYDVTGPIGLIFSVPPGTDVQLLSQDEGFGLGYDIVQTFDARLKNNKDKIDIEISVVVPAGTKDLPVLVEFVPDGTIKSWDKKDGKTNQRIKVKTELRKPKADKSGKSDD